MEIFSALKNFTLLQPDIDKACDGVQRQQLNGILHKLQQTVFIIPLIAGNRTTVNCFIAKVIVLFQGSKALDQFLDFVKVDTGTNLVGMGAGTLTSNVPKDATVHELTSNTIWFIEHLYEHYNVIADILQQDLVYVTQLDSITSQKMLSVDDRNKTFLGLYISKCSYYILIYFQIH